MKDKEKLFYQILEIMTKYYNYKFNILNNLKYN